ncbi:hypothetical protein DENSPDRAFT_804457 [Dentipellis sp. KUC8613]|nr:hypothetical protein DENSPDRAFT_804457 [Dentipellis sp. KUC8613]
MSSSGDPPSHPHVDKGKARATPDPEPDPTETTPLLGSPSPSAPSALHVHSELPSARNHAHRRLLRLLLTVFLTTFTLAVIVLLFIALAYSYASRAQSIPTEELVERSLIVRGPDSVRVLNLTHGGGLWVEVGARIGFDAGAAIEVKPDEDDAFILRAWKAIGRWGIDSLDSVSVQMAPIDVHSEDPEKNFLASVTTPPLQIPLTSNPPKGDEWLTSFSLPVLIKPTQNTTAWLNFARACWREGFITAQTSIPSVLVHGGGIAEHGWRSRLLKLERHDVEVAVRQKLPLLPGFPPPGHDLPAFSDLLTITSMHVTSPPHPAPPNSTLGLAANISIINPIPPTLPFNAIFTTPPLPFIISLPPPMNLTTPISISNITVHPLTLTLPPPAHTNLSLSLSGVLLPPHAAPGIAALSTLISAYLSAHPAPLLIHTPLLPDLQITTALPPPHPRPHVLRSVTLRDMHIKPVGTEMRASGEVRARVVLPRGFDVRLEVGRVLPDVLVFDGPVPDGDSDGDDDADDGELSVVRWGGGDGDRDGPLPAPPAPPLPDPLPPRAFAHIRPDDWLPADSEPGNSTNPDDGDDDEDDDGSVTLVRALLVDVPLQVLPGREKEFSNFVGKVIFGHQPALAGVQGTAAVAVRVAGLGGAMELTGLPFQGTVKVGKR